MGTTTATAGDATQPPMTRNDDGVDRRTVLKTAGASGVTASFAGCSSLLGGGDGDDGDGTPTGDGTGDGTAGDGNGATTEPEQLPSDQLRAGLLTYQSGAPAVLGIQAQRGAELAVRHINENGGVAGTRRLQLNTVDEAESALNKYQSFVDNDVDVTFGPISSGTHAQMAPQVEDNEVINVATDGTVTNLYEETVPDPTYSFRFQNYDVMETTVAAIEAVERIGADNIDTVAGVNPGYTFGEDEMAMFERAIVGLTGADVVYSGFPDLGASDMSTHVSQINNNEPDVTFSSLWGGDVTTFFQQASSRNMFDNTTVVGTTLYSAAGDVPASALEGAEVYSGSRNYYWGHPDRNRWPPGESFFDEATSQQGITVPTAHYMSGYGAVLAWATAVEKAIDLLGGNEYPSQEQIAMALEEHGFFTPAGYHNMCQDHQGRSNGFAGRMVYDDDLGAAVLEDTNVYSATQISPPPMGSRYEVTAADWLDGWQ